MQNEFRGQPITKITIRLKIGEVLPNL